eukprot:1282943-Rhodomonas_salina.2
MPSVAYAISVPHIAQRMGRLLPAFDPDFLLRDQMLVAVPIPGPSTGDFIGIATGDIKNLDNNVGHEVTVCVSVLVQPVDGTENELVVARGTVCQYQTRRRGRVGDAGPGTERQYRRCIPPLLYCAW